MAPTEHVHRFGVFARDAHVKTSAVVQTLSPSEGVPAPVCRVLRVLELMPQVITWVQESAARSGATMALGLVQGRYMQTNVDKITASVPIGADGREIDLQPVLEYCTPYAYRAARMVDHSDFIFDTVPPRNAHGEVANVEPATEQLFSRASVMSLVPTPGDVSTSSAWRA